MNNPFWLGVRASILLLASTACGASNPGCDGESTTHATAARRPASAYVTGVRLPPRVIMRVDTPDRYCVELMNPSDMLPLSDDLASADATLSAYARSQLRPVVGEAAAINTLRPASGGPALSILIVSFARLPEYVEVVAELMSHQRSPVVYICAGARLMQQKS